MAGELNTLPEVSTLEVLAQALFGLGHFQKGGKGGDRVLCYTIGTGDKCENQQYVIVT